MQLPISDDTVPFNLSSINLSFNDFVGTLPSEIGKLYNLELLLVGINKLTGTLPTEYGNLFSLQRFTLSGNKLNGTIPDTWITMGNNSTAETIGKCVILSIYFYLYFGYFVRY